VAAFGLDHEGEVRIRRVLIGEDLLLTDQEDIVSASSQRRDHFGAMTTMGSRPIPPPRRLVFGGRIQASAVEGRVNSGSELTGGEWRPGDRAPTSTFTRA
jgi:hypothetical protein